MQNRLTIKDIARLSGVGKSTVSRVLNNESGVSQRTRERVEAVMNQHGFSPSRSARAMRGQSDKVVAIIVTRLDSLSENLAVQTMLPAFYEQGYDPIMIAKVRIDRFRRRNFHAKLITATADHCVFVAFSQLWVPTNRVSPHARPCFFAQCAAGN